jgi:hypothetical protein
MAGSQSANGRNDGHCPGKPTVRERDAGRRLLDDHVHVVLRVLVRLDGRAEAEQVRRGDRVLAAVVEDVLVRRDVVPIVVAEVAPREAGRERLAADLHLTRGEEQRLHVDAVRHHVGVDRDARHARRRAPVVRGAVVGDVGGRAVLRHARVVAARALAPAVGGRRVVIAPAARARERGGGREGAPHPE